jgi:1,5-anhydro-D-fructose reductase (1,5-anhydro-D-mannitol-forming)
MTVRWGIIGCGKVTEVKSGPAFQKAEGSALVAVMRRDGALAADYARRHGVPRSYADAQELIDDPEVDAVYIATPPGEHERLALRVCAAKKPAYVEKPMARHHGECLRMNQAFAAARVPLFVAYYRRGLARFRKARELVASGALGTVTGVSVRFAGPYHKSVAPGADPASLPWRLVAEQSGGGLFLDLGCHTLDVLDFVLGPLEDVVGTAANVITPHAVEDAVALRFRTESGALGTAQWNFAAAERADAIVISGDRAELRLSTFGDEPVELHRGDDAPVETFVLPNPPHIQQPLVQSIVDELRGRGRCDSTGVSAARTQAVMDAALLGYYGHREDGFWKTPAAWPGRRH